MRPQLVFASLVVMPARRRIEPRRRPLQARSQATVDAVMQATAYILVRDGYARLTTNRIAERAGVNIASLYQFFPNKGACPASKTPTTAERPLSCSPRGFRGG